MTALAGRYHVIRYDQCGFGRSSPPAARHVHADALRAQAAIESFAGQA